MNIYNDKHRIQKLLSNAHSISDMLMIDCHCVISECKEDVSAWMRTSRRILCTTQKGSIERRKLVCNVANNFC